MKSCWIVTKNHQNVLEFRDVPVPQPKAGEIVIKVHASALNRGELFVGGVVNHRAAEMRAAAFPRKFTLHDRVVTESLWLHDESFRQPAIHHHAIVNDEVGALRRANLIAGISSSTRSDKADKRKHGYLLAGKPRPGVTQRTL